MRFAKIVILLALVGLAHAQSSTPQVTATASIEGVVVKIGTNEPIADADLELSRIEGTPAAPLNPGAAELFAAVLFGSNPPGLGGAEPPSQIAPEIKYAKTSADGKFSFTDLKEGKYRLAAIRVGSNYFPAEYGQHDVRQRGLPFPVTAGQAVRNLKLEMATTGAITGQVVDEDGQPIGHATVMALSEQYQKGEPRWYIERIIMTDERGNYRLFWLGPGRYKVAAVYENPQQRNMNMGPAGPPGRGAARYRATSPNLTRQIMPNGEIVEEAYGVVYHGGVVDPLLARSIDVHPGEQYNGIDISMGVGKSRTHHLRGTVISGATGQPVAGAQVGAIPLRWSPNALVLTGTTNARGMFDLSGAFPERYVLGAVVVAPSNNQLPPGVVVPAGVVLNGGVSQIGYLSVEVANGDIENIRVVANDGVNISGHVVIEGRPASANDPDLPRMNVSLVRAPDLIAMPPGMMPLPPLPPGTPPNSRPGNGQVLASGDFNLLVSQGDYRLNVNGSLPSNGYVKSIRIGGDDIQRSGMHVAGAVQNPIQIVIGTDGGSIGGSVLASVSGTMPNAVVALVPDAFDLRSRSDLYRSATTDAQGNFRLASVPPGNYKLFAWEWAEPDAWQNPEFIRPIENTGRSITMTASDKQDNIQLNAIMLRTAQ
jgi:uncharacterized protein (DUF2141 family)